MIELKPCPFCGNNNILWSLGWGMSHGVMCGTCGASFQHRKSQKEAAEAWNRRTYQPEEIESEFMRICEAQMEKES